MKAPSRRVALQPSGEIVRQDVWSSRLLKPFSYVARLSREVRKHIFVLWTLRLRQLFYLDFALLSPLDFQAKFLDFSGIHVMLEL